MQTNIGPLLIQFQPRVESCPICRSSQLAPGFALSVADNSLNWNRCRVCGVVFQNPQLTADSIQAIYASELYWGSKSKRVFSNYSGYQYDPVRIKQSEKRMEVICRVTGLSKGRLLDVGCATGFFAYACKKRGFDVLGVDPSPQMAEFGRKRYHVPILCTTLEQAPLEPSYYDLITLWGTDSHLSNPVESFKKITAALQPGGFLAMNYQDFSHWIRLFFPGIKRSWNALYNLTDRSCDELLRQAGLRLVYRRTEWQWSRLGHVLRVLKFPEISWLEKRAIYLPALSFKLFIAQKIIDH